MNDILTVTDVEPPVHTFYATVRSDEMSSPIFNAVIKGDWDLLVPRPG